MPMTLRILNQMQARLDWMREMDGVGDLNWREEADKLAAEIRSYSPAILERFGGTWHKFLKEAFPGIGAHTRIQTVPSYRVDTFSNEYVHEEHEPTAMYTHDDLISVKPMGKVARYKIKLEQFSDLDRREWIGYEPTLNILFVVVDKPRSVYL